MFSTPKPKLSVKKPNGPPKRQDEITALFFLLCHREKKAMVFYYITYSESLHISTHTYHSQNKDIFPENIQYERNFSVHTE